MISLDDIQTIAVVGAGTMGQGIAQVFATSGFKTKLFDADEKLTRDGLEGIRFNLTRAVEKGRLSGEQKLYIESQIILCKTLQEIQADLIIEAIVEKLEVKQELFRELEKINEEAGRNTIFVTNTSSLSVSGIAAGLKHPERCVGLHFFNPAHQMKLVEVVGGAATKPEITILMVALSKKIGKIPVMAKDSPGFIVNRVARHYYVESLKVLEDGVSDVGGIDKLMRSAGFKMGPFELMDLIGLDTNYSVTDSMHKAFLPNPKFMPSTIQKQKIEAGYLGRKTGKGFYDYSKN